MRASRRMAASTARNTILRDGHDVASSGGRRSGCTGVTAPLLRQNPRRPEVLCRLYKSPLEPRSHSYPPMRIFIGVGGDERRRKTSHDEDDYVGRIDDGAGCDLRTGVGGYRRSGCVASCPRIGQPDGNARVRCGGASDGGAQCAPLSRRTESERLRLCRRP